MGALGTRAAEERIHFSRILEVGIRPECAQRQRKKGSARAPDEFRFFPGDPVMAEAGLFIT